MYLCDEELHLPCILCEDCGSGSVGSMDGGGTGSSHACGVRE